MKVASVFGFAAWLFVCSTLASPPFYYGKTVKITNRQSIYFGCSGTIEAWVDGAVTVIHLCDDFKSANFEASELELKCKGNRCGL